MIIHVDANNPTCSDPASCILLFTLAAALSALDRPLLVSGLLPLLVSAAALRLRLCPLSTSST
jgi:hypothetical protein